MALFVTKSHITTVGENKVRTMRICKAILILLIVFILSVTIMPALVFPLTIQETNTDGKINPVFVLKRNSEFFLPVEWTVIVLRDATLYFARYDLSVIRYFSEEKQAEIISRKEKLGDMPQELKELILTTEYSSFTSDPYAPKWWKNYNGEFYFSINYKHREDLQELQTFWFSKDGVFMLFSTDQW